jgi:hypothetical protein
MHGRHSMKTTCSLSACDILIFFASIVEMVEYKQNYHLQSQKLSGGRIHSQEMIEIKWSRVASIFSISCLLLQCLIKQFLLSNSNAVPPSRCAHTIPGLSLFSNIHEEVFLNNL